MDVLNIIRNYVWLRNKREKSKNDPIFGLDNWVTVVPSAELRKKKDCSSFRKTEAESTVVLSK